MTLLSCLGASMVKKEPFQEYLDRVSYTEDKRIMDYLRVAGRITQTEFGRRWGRSNYRDAYYSALGKLIERGVVRQSMVRLSKCGKSTTLFYLA